MLVLHEEREARRQREEERDSAREGSQGPSGRHKTRNLDPLGGFQHQGPDCNMRSPSTPEDREFNKHIPNRVAATELHFSYNIRDIW